MKEIIFNCGVLQKSAAVLQNGELCDVLVDHPSQSGGVGNIYKGTVTNVMPGMQAAFVDIGLDKNAFLFSDDIIGDKSTDIRKKIKQGQDITVQVTKEAQGVKGARVTTDITLPGHKTVMLPGYDYVGVSKKISDEEEKERLRGIMQRIKPKEHGYIVRTDAFNASEEELKYEIDFLEETWNKISKQAKIKNAPCLLYGEDGLLLTVVRDYLDDAVDKLIINSEKDFEEIKRIARVMAPGAENRIFYKEGNLYSIYGIENKLRKLLERKVWLDNGAYLVIDYTEALTVIDVNTGKFTGDYDFNRTVLKTNIAAAKEIARQLRLRSVGGIIVVDFIDMEKEEDRQEVLKVLKEAVESDRVKTNVLGFAALGLVEMSRKKTKLSLSQAMQRTCPYCEGDGRILNGTSVLDMLLSELKRTRRENTKAILRLNPYVLNDLKKYDDVLCENFDGLEIYVREDAGMHIEDYNIRFVDNISDEEGLIRLI